MDDLNVKSLIEKQEEHQKLSEYHARIAQSFADVIEAIGGANVSKIKTVNPVIIGPNSQSFKLPETSKRKQVLYFLTKKLEKSALLSDIQKLWVKETGRTDDVTQTVRWLKDNNFVVKKSYGNNNYTYWGLKDWFDTAIDDFKPEYKTFSTENQIGWDFTDL